MGAVSSVTDLDQAMLYLCHNPKTSMVICDAMDYAEDHLALTAFIRWSEYWHDFRIPVVILSSVWTPERFRAARDMGPTALMIMPMSHHSLFRRFMSLQVSERPFIDSECYRGPDRRVQANPAYPGPFRRAKDRVSLKDPHYVEPPKKKPEAPLPPLARLDPSVANQAAVLASLQKKP